MSLYYNMSFLFYFIKLLDIQINLLFSGTTPSGRTGAAAQIVNGKVLRTKKELTKKRKEKKTKPKNETKKTKPKTKPKNTKQRGLMPVFSKVIFPK
jgi:hypothetical protein